MIGRVASSYMSMMKTTLLLGADDRACSCVGDALGGQSGMVMALASRA